MFFSDLNFCNLERSECKPVGDDDYVCECDEGYKQVDDILCVDINECELSDNKCHENADCVNEIGAYYCKCKEGYIGNGTACRGQLTFFLLENFGSSVKNKVVVLSLPRLMRKLNIMLICR